MQEKDIIYTTKTGIKNNTVKPFWLKWRIINSNDSMPLQIYRSLTRCSTYKLHVLLFFIAHKTFLFLPFYFISVKKCNKINFWSILFFFFLINQISLRFDGDDISYRINKEVMRLKYDLFTFNYIIHI